MTFSKNRDIRLPKQKRRATGGQMVTDKRGLAQFAGTKLYPDDRFLRQGNQLADKARSISTNANPVDGRRESR